MSSQAEFSSLHASLPGHIPGPTWTSSQSAGVLQPPETLLCRACPMKSRGAVASRNQAPMKWEGFVQLRIKTFYPVKEKNLPAPPQSILDWQEESVFQHNCRKSRRIPDLTKGYGLQTETLTNTGQKHKYVNTGGSHPTGMSLLTLWSRVYLYTRAKAFRTNNGISLISGTETA